MSYTETDMHEITHEISQEKSIYICFFMSEEDKKKNFGSCMLIMASLLRMYSSIIEQLPVRTINPELLSDPDKKYRLDIQMNVEQTTEDNPRIYFYFEVYNYDDQIDCSENYININPDQNNQVYIKEMNEILNGTLKHYVYGDLEDEDNV